MSFLRYSFYLILILASCNKKSNDETVASETTATEEIANSAPQTNSTNEVTPPMPTASSDVQIKVFKNTSAEHPSGYGYDILMDGRLYIHQTNIPAIPGNKGFTSEDDALKTGELMAFKIRNNIMPPSITIEELDSLGVNMK